MTKPKLGKTLKVWQRPEIRVPYPTAVQQSLFEPDTRQRDSGLMDTLDSLRKRFGYSVVRYGVQGTEGKWKRQSDNLSPCYTTRLEDLIKAY